MALKYPKPSNKIQNIKDNVCPILGMFSSIIDGVIVSGVCDLVFSGLLEPVTRCSLFHVASLISVNAALTKCGDSLLSFSQVLKYLPVKFLPPPRHNGDGICSCCSKHA